MDDRELITYEQMNFRAASLDKIELINGILDEYREMNFTLTVRQLYYQMVARDYIPNSQKEYKKIIPLLTNGRLAGLIDWNAIEDRTRNLTGNAWFTDPAHAIRSVIYRYRIDKWQNQPNRVEVWIEKDALAGVIAPVCGRLDVDYFSCRGYVSLSEMWKAGAKRIRSRHKRGQETVILHLGDHDPSGIDMTRDIEDRLSQFAGFPVEVNRIALNWDQIQLYNPPPNFAKVTGSRAPGYIKKFGDRSWELDALRPEDMAELIRTSVAQYRDEGLYAARQEIERAGRAKLEELMAQADL